VAERLLAAGADPNARQLGGFVPLHAAAQNGDKALAELLLDHGADPSLETDDGRSAAAIARAAGHDELAVRLG
jgi:ankyrin repeat protein